MNHPPSSALSPSIVLAALDRPAAPWTADISDHVLKLKTEKPKKFPISKTTILVLKLIYLYADAPHRSGAGGE